MSIGHGGNIVKDGLVFAYDMASKQSWKGKPTTNEFNQAVMYTGGYGGDGTVLSGVLDPFGTTDNEVRRKTGKLRFGVTNGTDVGTLYNGTTYTFTIYMRHVPGYLKGYGQEFDICDRNDIRYYQDDKGNWVQFESGKSLGDYMDYEWRRFAVTALHNNSASYHFIDIGIYNGTNVFEFSCPMIEQGTVPSPFTPYGTPRTNTQSLIDLNGNTITANNLVYNSDNTFEFNGSSLSLPALNFPTGQTIEIWLRPKESDSARRNPYNQAYGGYGTWTHEPSGIINYYYGDGAGNASPYIGHGSGFTVVENELACVCTTRDTSVSWWYKNGVKYNSYTHSFGTLASHSSGITIGSGYAGSYIGDIVAVKLYDRALTEAEVKQNFNASKSKYGFEDNNPGPLAFYDFSLAQTKDLSPNGNDLTLNGNAVYQNEGYWDFGADSYLSTTLTPEGFGNFTLMGWFRVTTTTSSWQDIICSYDSPSTSVNWLRLALYQGKATLYIDANNSNNLVQSTYVPPLNTWVFIAGVREGNVGKIYINGSLVHSASVSATVIGSAAANNFVLGNISRPSNLSEDLQGDIGYVKIYNRALSDSEIQSAAANGRFM